MSSVACMPVGGTYPTDAVFLTDAQVSRLSGYGSYYGEIFFEAVAEWATEQIYFCDPERPEGRPDLLPQKIEVFMDDVSQGTFGVFVDTRPVFMAERIEAAHTKREDS